MVISSFQIIQIILAPRIQTSSQRKSSKVDHRSVGPARTAGRVFCLVRLKLRSCLDFIHKNLLFKVFMVSQELGIAYFFIKKKVGCPRGEERSKASPPSHSAAINLNYARVRETLTRKENRHFIEAFIPLFIFLSLLSHHELQPLPPQPPNNRNNPRCPKTSKP